MIEADEQSNARSELLARGDPFSVTIAVSRVPGEGYIADATWQGEHVIARASAKDAVSAYRGAAEAAGQTLARNELAARLSRLDLPQGQPEPE